MKKKFIFCFLVVSILLSLFNINALANNDITIYVNDEILQCDVSPFIDNGRTMVPMRKIFEALNATVDWEGSTETITAIKYDTQIVLQINNPIMYNNGVAETLDVAPVIVDDSTFVPVRAVSQSLNATVEWVEETQSVYISLQEPHKKENDEFVQSWMMATYPAGYDVEWLKNVKDNVPLYETVCVHGFVSGTTILENDVYLLVDNLNSEERIAAYISDINYTSYEEIVNLFKWKHMALYGQYLGVDDTLNMPIVALESVVVFEYREAFVIEDLIYPKVSQLGQKVSLYDFSNESQHDKMVRIDSDIARGLTIEPNVTVVIEEDEVYEYIYVRGYQTYDEAQAAKAPSYSANDNYESNYNNQPNSGGSAVYRTPSGKRYHFDRNCGGKNSYQVSMQDAKNAGLTPCQKCAH